MRIRRIERRIRREQEAGNERKARATRTRRAEEREKIKPSKPFTKLEEQVQRRITEQAKASNHLLRRPQSPIHLLTNKPSKQRFSSAGHDAVDTRPHGNIRLHHRVGDGHLLVAARTIRLSVLGTVGEGAGCRTILDVDTAATGIVVPSRPPGEALAG
jgi:hypothetical protein